MYDTIARSVTPQDVKSCIKAAYYLNASEAVDKALHPFGLESVYAEDLKLLTLCILVLNNGFTIVGKSACADPNKYDDQIGRKLAYADACKQVEPFLGFLLKQDLYEEEIFEDVMLAMSEALNEDEEAFV